MNAERSIIARPLTWESPADLPLPRTLSGNEGPLHHTDATIPPRTALTSSLSSLIALLPQASIRSSLHHSFNFWEFATATHAHPTATKIRIDATRTLSGDEYPLHHAEATIITPLHPSGVLLIIPDSIVAHTLRSGPLFFAPSILGSPPLPTVLT
ncbi:hypothetical protein ACLOJK_041475 [Asimina triloba]